MIKLTPCANAPFQPPGIAVKALYFTKPAGEKSFNVYAQYEEGKTWVPLHIAFPANPTLQQVRDMDRNIAMDTGSYEDAHFYLRSADGNNMTAAYFTNAAGGGIQVGNTDDYAPLNLQPDGGLLTYGGAEVATRQWVELYGLTYKNTPVTNFNTVTVQGIYFINNLTAIANYPNIGGNNNGAVSGYLVAYGVPATIQYFYPINEQNTLNRSGGYWYRRTATDVWEYKDGVLEISLNSFPVHADDMLVSGDYLIGGSMTNMLNYGYPDSGALGGGSIPFMLTVRRRWGNVSWNFSITQELVCMQESPYNFTRKWIRSKFNWRSTGHAWDAWNEVAFKSDLMPVEDNRQVIPNELPSGVRRVQFGFGTWNNNNAAPYADQIHFNTYIDASGGSQNLVSFSKSGIGMRIWQANYNNSSPYSTFKDVAFQDNVVDRTTDAGAQPLVWRGIMNNAANNNLDAIVTAGVYTCPWQGDWATYVTSKPPGALNTAYTRAILEVFNEAQQGNTLTMQRLTLHDYNDPSFPMQAFTRMKVSGGASWGTWLQTSGPSGTLPLGGVLLSADNPAVDVTVATVANNKLGKISVLNNSGALVNNLSVTVEYTQPYGTVAKAIIFPANLSAAVPPVSPGPIYLKDNNQDRFIIFIKAIAPGDTMLFDYNVQGY